MSMAADVARVSCSMIGALKGGEGEGDSEIEVSKEPITAKLGEVVQTSLKGIKLSVKLSSVTPMILPAGIPAEGKTDQEQVDSPDDDQSISTLAISLSRGKVESATTWVPSRTTTGTLTMIIKRTHVTVNCHMSE
jgi:hypothetical protein